MNMDLLINAIETGCFEPIEVEGCVAFAADNLNDWTKLVADIDDTDTRHKLASLDVKISDHTTVETIGKVVFVFSGMRYETDDDDWEGLDADDFWDRKDKAQVDGW